MTSNHRKSSIKPPGAYFISDTPEGVRPDRGEGGY